MRQLHLGVDVNVELALLYHSGQLNRDIEYFVNIYKEQIVLTKLRISMVRFQITFVQTLFNFKVFSSIHLRNV